ncbi:acyltransferase [Formosa haliotis]|uniref:acyltransferase n=1 Tax=Formosa haliotis TaxID=1555194 RepID=UPI00082670B8|nr:DapH/DapD/GlmU-related protein [Formosa haliotis]
MKVFTAFIKSMGRELSKIVYSVYLLSRFNFKGNPRIDFPLNVRGKGRALIGDNNRLGKHSFITVEGELVLGNDSHIHSNSQLIVEKNASFKTGGNFQLEPFCVIRVKNSNWKLGENISISSYCQLYSREKGMEGNLIIGNNSNVSNNTIIDLSGDVIIGDNVAIANNCFIFTHNHKYTDKSVPSWKGGLIIKNVVIEDGCWIGANTKILPGVSIGKRSVVAAGSVVTKNVLENTIVAGNPAKLLKSI